MHGVVDSVNVDTANLVQGRISSGSLFEATFTFDSARTDSSPANSLYGGYYGLGSATLKIGTMPLISTTPASEVDVFVLNDPGVDEYQVLATLVDLPAPAPNAVALDLDFAIDLITFNNLSALTSDALLSDLPNIDDFEKKAFGLLGRWTVNGVLYETAVEGHLTTFVLAVPEPASSALVALGIGALMIARRRKSIGTKPCFT